MNSQPGVKSYFDNNATSFNSLYEKKSLLLRWNRLLRYSVYERVDTALSLINHLGNPSVLDVGCGSGRNSFLFLDAGASCVHGIDFSETMLHLANNYAHSSQYKERISFECTDFLNLEVGKRKWDLIIALGFLEYFKDILQPLTLMYGVSNTVVFFSIRHPSIVRMPIRKLSYQMKGCPIYFYKKNQIDRMCREAGFNKVHIIQGAGSCYYVTAYK